MVSVVECKATMRFGVGYFVQPIRTNFVSFTFTWHHPHFVDKDGRTSVERNHVIRQPPNTRVMGLQFLTWRLEPSELLDGDFVLEVRDKERLLLAHKFEVRGCDKP